MSRSILKDKYIRECMRSAFITSKDEGRNKHQRDEMPKNRPSRLVTMHCHASVDWLQDAGSFGGHRRIRGGHRMVSGLVRASLKRELRKQLEEIVSLDSPIDSTSDDKQ